MVRFWIDPSGDLFITFTMNGAEQQTTVPMTAGTFVSVEVRQYKVETQVRIKHRGRHLKNMNNSNGSVAVCVPSEG